MKTKPATRGFPASKLHFPSGHWSQIKCLASFPSMKGFVLKEVLGDFGRQQWPSVGCCNCLIEKKRRILRCCIMFLWTLIPYLLF